MVTINMARLTLLIATLLGFGIRPQVAADGEPIAVVVNLSNSMSDVSLVDLRRLYRGNSTRMADGTAVVLMEHESVRGRFYPAAVGMTADRVRRHWITVVFSGGGGVPPTGFANAQSLLRAVAETSGAVAILLLSEVDETVKVLTVDDLPPGDSAYALR